MQKKLLAVAVAGALAPAAAMAQSTVEIYGRANVGIDQFQAKGATIDANNMDGRMRVFDGSSRLGFRVNETLGGGMRAFVVLETGVNFDTGSNAGQGGTNPSSGFWASRSSYAGLGGGWGDVRFGRQDVFYGNGIIQQAGANYINTAVDGIWTHHPVAAPGGRTSNTLSYNSPTIGGFNASLSWSPAAGGEGASYTGTDQEQEARWGITARYTTGALRAQFDWAVDRNVSNVEDAERTGWKIGLGWAYAPGSQISVVTGRLENEGLPVGSTVNTANVSQGIAGDARVNITTFNWEHMLGQWQLIAQLMLAGDVKGGTGLGAGDDTGTRGITLAAKYFLSKRTGVYFSFNQYRNEERGFTDFGPGACLSSAGGGAGCHLTAGAAGADPRIIALGVMHNF